MELDSTYSLHQWAGIDEAGRGPLAGAVVAAAVVLPIDVKLPKLNDSKKLNDKVKDELFDQILAQATAFHIAECSALEIDQFNIFQATMLAMTRAWDGLNGVVPRVLIDGNKVPKPLMAIGESAVKGDARHSAIAAASILAKVTRDRQLLALDAQYPEYGFAQHKGYPTPDHLKALKIYGPCPAHRRSFAPVRALLQEELF